MEVSGQLHSRIGRFTTREIVPGPIGPHNQSGRGGEEKNAQPLAGLEIPVIKLVAQLYTTELHQLPVWTQWRG
jgi:hypothetical protein